MVELLIAAAAVGLGAATIATHFELERRLRLRHRLRAGTSTLEEGEVATLTGTIRLLGAPLRAPLSGSPCALYRLVGRSLLGPGLATEVLTTEAVMARFALMTSHGEVLVDGERVEITWPVRRVSPRRPEREQAVRLRLGLNTTNTASLKEVAIPDGARVSVHGVLHRELAARAAERDYRDARTVLVLRGHPEHPLTVGRPRG